jgi:trimeric autotransporter adhesin
MKNFAALLALAMFVVLVSPSRLHAQEAESRVVTSGGGAASVPSLIQFNGTLRDSTSRPVSGVASVTFAIYAEQDGGTALWSETQNVLADTGGHYNVLLGSATASGVPTELFGTGQSRWLGVTIARQSEMPRVLLASVPYALKAGDADTLGGLPASAYVTTQSLAARSVAPLALGSTTILTAPAASMATASVPGTVANAATQSVTQAAVTGTGTTNYIPVWNSGSNLVNSKIFQGTNGYIGVNTITPQLQLDVTGNSIFRGSVQLPPQGTATASTGQPSRSFQWESSLYNSSTKAPVTEAFGFRAVPATNNTASPTAKFDLFYGPGGGTLTDLGFSFSNTGIVTFAPGQTFNGSELVLPNSSTSSNAGTMVIGGNPFLADYGDPSNTFVGANSGIARTATGQQNSALGEYSLDYDSTGSANTAVGAFALYLNTTGSNNVAIGPSALEESTSANNNVAIGNTALYHATTGGSNIAIGFDAGQSLTTGTGNTLIGADTDVAFNTTNSTVIGVDATTSSNNVIVLGVTGVNQPAVGIGTTAPQHTLDVFDRGLASYSLFSITSNPGSTATTGFSSATTGLSNGGMFESDSPNGSGVVAINDKGGYAGYFEATGGGYAGAFVGNVSVTGNLNVMGTVTKGGGAFKIDDPIDPAGKYLSHSFVESPDMMDIYNGIVTLDAHGRATIQMPAWFSALNRDFRYQLTAIGAPGPKLYVAAEVEGNQFAIAGGKKGQRVSWQVTGIRQDPWANAHRIPNEEEKPANEQGKYLHPDLYGAGPEQAIVGNPAAAHATSAEPAGAATGTADGRR